MHVRHTVVSLSLLSLTACMEQGFATFPPRYLAVETNPAIRIEPAKHDFGTPWLGCELAQAFRIHNDGDADLVVSKIKLDGASEQLILHDPNSLPVTIPPGELVSLEVSYHGLDTKDDYGQIVAVSNDPDDREATADVRGKAKIPGPVEESFLQPYQPKTDILVVIDNSGSMDEEQNALTTNFQQFMDAIVAANADFRVATITTDDPAFVGPMITLTTPDPVNTFTRQVMSIGTDGSGDEMPLEMVELATSPGGDAAPGGTFLRDDSMIAVVVVTDEPDEYSSTTPQAFVDHLVALKGGNPDLVRFHTIGGDVPDPVCEMASNASVPMDEVVALTGGLFVSVCGNWGSTLTAVGTGSVSLADRFQLADEAVADTIEVIVDGVPVTTGWTYDPGTHSVVFDVGAMPESDTLVEITYVPLPDCTDVR